MSAEQVMALVNGRPRGISSQMQIEMSLHSSRGDYRKQVVSEREKSATGYRTVYWIAAPEHEKGIGLLLSEDSTEQGMWMYFPVSRQTVHVVSRGLSALASDFSCEDLLTQVSLSDYAFRILGHELSAGYGVYRIEMKPASERLRSELGFDTAIGWIRDDAWMIVRADYLDDSGSVFKSFTATDVEIVQGVWTARRLVMDNRRAQHSTEVRVVDVTYSDQLPKDVWTTARFGKGLDPPAR